MADILCYTGGFPNWDADEPESVARDLPPSATARVMAGNAAEFFRGIPAMAASRTARPAAAVENLA
jgi:hypothetical protein